jgi:hypothetical protein
VLVPHGDVGRLLSTPLTGIDPDAVEAWAWDGRAVTRVRVTGAELVPAPYLAGLFPRLAAVAGA